VELIRGRSNADPVIGKKQRTGKVQIEVKDHEYDGSLSTFSMVCKRGLWIPRGGCTEVTEQMMDFGALMVMISHAFD